MWLREVWLAGEGRAVIVLHQVLWAQRLSFLWATGDSARHSGRRHCEYECGHPSLVLALAEGPCMDCGSGWLMGAPVGAVGHDVGGGIREKAPRGSNENFADGPWRRVPGLSY